METDEMTVLEWSDDMIAWAREYVMQIDVRVRRMLRERPLLSLIGAAAFGCLAGRVMSRR
jgi:hypothetical protein